MKTLTLILLLLLMFSCEETDTFNVICQQEFKFSWSPKSESEVNYNIGFGTIRNISIKIDDAYYYGYSVKDSTLTITANDEIRNKCMVEAVVIVGKGWKR